MSNIRFVWDPKKAESNHRKHGVSFEEARTVFYDEMAQLIPDPDHSEAEERFVMIGRSSFMRVLVVCHCYRENVRLLELSLQERRPSVSKNFTLDNI